MRYKTGLPLQLYKAQKKLEDPREIIQDWIANHDRLVQRWEKIVEMLRSSIHIDYVILFTTFRELSDLFHENS